MNGFLMLENMLDSQNAGKAADNVTDKVKEANGMLEEGRLLEEKWLAEFQEMCEENEVQL
jgi:hypothetical protein